MAQNDWKFPCVHPFSMMKRTGTSLEFWSAQRIKTNSSVSEKYKNFPNILIGAVAKIFTFRDKKPVIFMLLPEASVSVSLD